MNNTHTKKQYGGSREMPVTKAQAPKDVHAANRGAKYEGQVKGRSSETFAEPLNKGAPAKITGVDGLHNDIGESSGFITDGYLDKGDTPFGEDAKFNFLPPGMDISNQKMLEVNQMPMRKIVAESYPGDGWMPTPRDVQE